MQKIENLKRRDARDLIESRDYRDFLYAVDSAELVDSSAPLDSRNFLFFYHFLDSRANIFKTIKATKTAKTIFARLRPYALAFLSLIFALLVFAGCANESVYRGGIGAFRDFEALNLYRAKGTTTLNYANQAISGAIAGGVAGDVFELLGRNFNASNSPVDSFSGGNSSLMAGMRESEAIQRATMRPYQIAGKWYYPTKVKIGETFDGIASWYGPNFHAKATSNGETYNMHAHTAASKTLPMNTIVKVLNKENGKTTIVRINDRGPFVEGRIIDLSNIAAKDIDMVSKGTARVKVEVIGFGGMVDKNYQNSLKISSEEIQDEFEVGESQESVQGGAFALQLGVFRQKSGAESTKQKFEGITKQYSISIKEDGELYRVFANGFQSEDEAQDFAKSQGLTPVIVRE